VRLLITGGSGFVGRHLVARALRAGHHVTLLSRDPQAAQRALATPTSGAPGTLELRRADLARPADLAGLAQAASPQAVVHLAALIHGTPEALRAANVAATRALLAELARADPRPRLVHVSSFAVEDIPPTPYSESKLEGERVVREGPLPWVVLRPSLVYGPGDEGNTRPLVARLRAGSHWLPAGGRTRIQPVHVEDLAEACLAAAQAPQAAGRTYRIGGPEAVAVGDFRRAVREASGGRAAIRAIPLPLFALAARVLALAGRRGALGVLAFHRADHAVDIGEAQRDLGFRPRPLAQGLRETFAAGG
jgi:NADH dehydrogenase